MKKVMKWVLVFACIIGMCGCSKKTEEAVSSEIVQYFTGEYSDEKLEKLIENYEKNFSPLEVSSEAEAKQFSIEIGECKEAVISKIAPIIEGKNEIEDYIDLYLPTDYTDGTFYIDLSTIYTLQEADLYGFLIEMDLGDEEEYYYFRVSLNFSDSIRVGFNEVDDNQDVLINYQAIQLYDTGVWGIDIGIRNRLDIDLGIVCNELAINQITLHLNDGYLNDCIQADSDKTLTIFISQQELDAYGITDIHQIDLIIQINEIEDFNNFDGNLIYESPQIELYNDGQDIQKLDTEDMSSWGLILDGESIGTVYISMNSGTPVICIDNQYSYPIQFKMDSVTVNNKTIDYSLESKLILSNTQYTDILIPVSAYIDQAGSREKIEINFSYEITGTDGQLIDSGSQTLLSNSLTQIKEITDATNELFKREEVQDTILEVVPYTGELGEYYNDETNGIYGYALNDFNTLDELYTHMSEYFTDSLIQKVYSGTVSQGSEEKVPMFFEKEGKVYLVQPGVGENTYHTLYSEENSEFSVLEYDYAGGSATVLMKAAFEQADGSIVKVSIQLELVNEENQWKIDQYICYDDWK